MDTAVVTNATGGVGAAVARLFAEKGVHVVISASEQEALANVADNIDPDGETATAMRADIRDEFDVERLMETAARAGSTSGIDCVVANANVYHGESGATPLAETPYSGLDDTLRTNTRGVFATIREALPHLTDQARVLVPSDGTARDTEPGVGAYAVSKAGAEAVARQFAVELPYHVSVLEVSRRAAESAASEGRDPETVASMVWWAGTDSDVETADTAVIDVDTWRDATN